MSLSFAILTLAQRAGAPPRVDLPSTLLVTVMSSAVTPKERERFGKEREKATLRDDGSPLFVKRQDEFVILIERRLLPDDLTAMRMATLDALSRDWAPSGSISLGGTRSKAYKEGIVGQLQPESRRNVRASGAFLIMRDAQLVLKGGSRRELMTISDYPKLGDDLYPVGDVSPPAQKPAPGEASGSANGFPPQSRVAEFLDDSGPVTQSKGFDVAFRFNAERWRQDGQMLSEKYAGLDRALDDDLARRNPYGLPKAGTAFKDLDPKLQKHLQDDYGDN